MKPNDFIELAMRTEAKKKPYLALLQFRLLHSAMGMSTEANEFLDTLKKNIFYDAPMDMVNIKEEVGDVLWYAAQAIDTMRAYGEDVSFESLMETNIAKLKKRYPDKFTEKDALNRDLDAERKVLEK